MGTEKRFFTVSVVVEVDVEAWQYNQPDGDFDTQAPQELEEWSRAMLTGPCWQGTAEVVAGHVQGACMWFAHCDRDATNLTEHPVMGPIPTCQPHAEFAANRNRRGHVQRWTPV